jgi:ABC-2 type transport system permease protein
MAFLQQTLGKNYKWWYVILFYFKSHVTYLKDTFIRGFAELFGLGITIFIWYITTNNSTQFDTKEIITYLIIGFIYTVFTSSWFAEDLGYEIKTGNLTTSILRPTSKFLLNLFEYVGRGVFGEILTTFIPVILILPFVFQYILYSDFTNIFFTILFIPISYFIKHTIEVIFGCATFWLVNFGGMLRLKEILSEVLYGAKIPLNILAKYLPFVVYTPFAFILHYPVQIYLGKYSTTEIIYTFLGGIAWCFVLWILARVIFKFGLKRNEAVGL